MYTYSCTPSKNTCLLVYNYYACVQVWDADTGITLKTFAISTKDGFISCISLSVDNTRIAISNTEGLVMVSVHCM